MPELPQGITEAPQEANPQEANPQEADHGSRISRRRPIMGLRVTPANTTPVNITEAHGFVPPPTGSAEPEKAIDHEPLNFPPMVKDDELVAKPTTEEKPVVVGRREAVPKVGDGLVPGEFPNVGIDFGDEGDLREKQSTSVKTAKLADAGSFEKNFQEYLRKKNDGRATEGQAVDATPVSHRTVSDDGVVTHDLLPDGKENATANIGENATLDENGTVTAGDGIKGETSESTPTLVPGLEVNPGLQMLEEARRKIEDVQVRAFRETQGDFRSGIVASDKFVEDTFATYKLIMNEGMLGKSADEARSTLLKQHEELQTTLNGAPGQAFKEHLAGRSFEYLYGDVTPEQRTGILEGMRKLGAPVLADKLKLFGDSLATAGPILNQEAQMKVALQKAVSESFNMRTLYGESINQAMNHSSTTPEQKELDLIEMARLSNEQRALQERFDEHIHIPEINLDLRVNKNAPGVQEARFHERKQTA